jgi:hypothetical protein
VVNVPMKIDRTLNILPRCFDESHIIQIEFMRKMEYKKPYLYETIRPKIVLEAIRYLITQPLYINENITISPEWSELYKGDKIEFADRSAIRKNDFEQLYGSDFEDTEIFGQETIIEDQIDYLEIEKYKFAPAEDEIPKSIFFDENAEELSFPKIYCGIKSKLKFELSAGTKAKSEIMRYDRRCAENVTKILYSFKKSQMESLAKAIRFATRKRKGLTAESAANKEVLSQLIQHDDGYNILGHIRCSPAYWENKKKEVLAMIRQLGCPTFFITLSAAEANWPELLVILYQNVHKITKTEDEVRCLSYEEKADLIRKDPTTCARYFDYRFRCLLYSVLVKPGGPFREYSIEDFYYRIEFQHRGSPHVHMVVWLKNAPSYFKDNLNKYTCEKFIDSFVTCNANHPKIELQTHKHRQTCKIIRPKKDKNSCRFNFPLPIIPRTLILDPLTNEEKSR